MEELYTAMESVKDGLFTTSKGCNVKNVLMRPCHFVVFANRLPNLGGLAQKRFVIKKVPALQGTTPVPQSKVRKEKRFVFPGAEDVSDREYRTAFAEQTKEDQAEQQQR